MHLSSPWWWRGFGAACRFRSGPLELLAELGKVVNTAVLEAIRAYDRQRVVRTAVWVAVHTHTILFIRIRTSGLICGANAYEPLRIRSAQALSAALTVRLDRYAGPRYVSNRDGPARIRHRDGRHERGAVCPALAHGVARGAIPPVP